MFEAYKKYWRNYVNFTGESTRSDYWWVFLINILIQIIPIIMLITSIFLFANALAGNGNGSVVAPVILAIISGIWLLGYGLATMIPSIALSIRRIRDTGLSPWWYALVPAEGITATIGDSLGNNIWAGVFMFITIGLWLTVFIFYLLPSHTVKHGTSTTATNENVVTDEVAPIAVQTVEDTTTIAKSSNEPVTTDSHEEDPF